MLPQNNQDFTVRQSGVYRNLPTHPGVSGLTAVVTGATGISGWNTIRSLLDSPTRWTKIYAVSRSAPAKELTNLLTSEQQSRIHHLPIDLQGSAEEIARSLTSIREPNPYIFFYAYMQPKTSAHEAVWTNVDKLDAINSALFTSFLHALDLSHTAPRRILLQTGGKNYGFQLGRIPQPCVESDPQPRHLGANFYYTQEDSLLAYCARHPGTSWNVIRPFAVVGSALKAQMGVLYLLCVYAAVQAHKREPLFFPGDWTVWQAPSPTSTARLTGYLSEWAALGEGCADQAYNAVDSNSTTFERLFAEVARWYGNELGAVGPPDEGVGMERFEVRGGAGCPLGYGPARECGRSFKMLDWAREERNVSAWREIVEASGGGIRESPFEEDVVKENFGLLDIYFSIQVSVSMNKARLQGWTGFVDTFEAAFESAQEMVGMGLLPAMVARAARPLV